MAELQSQQRRSERTAVVDTDARGEASMSSQAQNRPSDSGMPPRSGRSLAALSTKNPSCPTCERRMTVKRVTAVLFASGLDDVVYSCEKCGTEAKRTVKRT
jgi:hypothetical protein